MGIPLLSRAAICAVVASPGADVAAIWAPNPSDVFGGSLTTGRSEHFYLVSFRKEIEATGFMSRAESNGRGGGGAQGKPPAVYGSRQTSLRFVVIGTFAFGVAIVLSLGDASFFFGVILFRLVSLYIQHISCFFRLWFYAQPSYNPFRTAAPRFWTNCTHSK